MSLVVQAGRLGTDLPQTIASNVARAGHPRRVVVQSGSESARGSGLLMDSVITTGNLPTIHHWEIDRVVGHFAAMEEIDGCIANDAGTTTWMSYACFPTGERRNGYNFGMAGGQVRWPTLRAECGWRHSASRGILNARILSCSKTRPKVLDSND
jgi:hypothetical protein